MSLAKIALAAATAATLTFAAIAPVFAEDTLQGVPTIAMQNYAFSPPDLVVPAGTTLTWVNNDPEQHDVAGDPNSSPDPNFISPPVDPGASWSYTFTVPGTYTYMCDLHENMVASLTVA